MSKPLKFVDPPNPKPGQRRWSEWDSVAKQLRDHPGKWALVAEDAASSLASHILNGRLKSFEPSGAFEAVARNTTRSDSGKRRADVYARYVGAES